MKIVAIALLWTFALQEGEKGGERPYELEWAGRREDDHPPLVDFEDLSGWKAVGEDAEARVERSRERPIWGRYVAKVIYRAAGPRPVVRIQPPEPVRIDRPFDAVTCWIYGNNWGYAPDPETPPVQVSALFRDPAGAVLDVPLARVDWKEWFLCHRRLTPSEIRRVEKGARFEGFVIRGGKNREDRVLYLDNLAVFTEEFKPLSFEPRPQRGIPMFSGQGAGTNTGPGRLPFPTRLETILPDNLAEGCSTRLLSDGKAFLFTYEGSDGRGSWRLEPATGTFSDLSVRWEGRGGWIRPCAGGGLYAPGGSPLKLEALGTRRDGDAVRSRWRHPGGEVEFVYRLWKKSLVVDVLAPGGTVEEVRYGRAEGVSEPRLVTIPYYLYGDSRPAVVVSGPPAAPLFLAGHTDWCLSNGSVLYALNAVEPEGVRFNGGIRYLPRTDGRRNDCFERLFLVLSPRFEEVLPTVPNPVSPWKRVTGTRVWRAHGAGNRQHDARHWSECHRYGMTEVVITDHETMWRDGGESFTFRTRTAPGKGGDAAQFEYTRLLQDRLGFVYGPYNNFTDFAPVNEFWEVDRVSRTPENQLQRAWFRCYAPKPARAVEFCARLAPEIQKKFGFRTAYCDVHTAVAPWDRVDYDARVPGAGTFAATFYAFGEILLLQKAAWNGPVYSEGNLHFPYCGLADGNYAQDQRYRPAERPWLVDFDLLKLHDLCCNFGMGNLEMFYGPGNRERPLDRFLAATAAFGHTGFLVYEGGLENALRSYYLLQQLHSRYALSGVQEIRYADAAGRLLDTTTAVASGAFERSQVLVRYRDGTCVAANGHRKERLRVEAWGRKIDLSPDGFEGWTADGSLEVFNGERDGAWTGYADTPAYLFIDGRGRWTHHPKAASDGIAVCRNRGGGEWEVIPFRGAECGFAVGPAAATALDREGKEIGPAEVRISRGLTFLRPVPGAFSYLLRPTGSPPPSPLSCDRSEVVPGETVTVRGRQVHEWTVPREARPGTRIWKEFEGSWIDFTVVPLAEVHLSAEREGLRVRLRSRLRGPEKFEVEAVGRTRSVVLEPGRPRELTLEWEPVSGETEGLLGVRIRAGGAEQVVEQGLRVVEGWEKLVDLPDPLRRSGMALRGQEERMDAGAHGAEVRPSTLTCGGVERPGIFMHPPWKGGVGYVFAEYDPVRLPSSPPAAFRAWVGKGDGSDPGDGILFRVVVVDGERRETAAEASVIRHEWVPLEADLTRWAGRTVRIRIVSDVGPRGDSSGDWACWAGMRIESRQRTFQRILDPTAERYRTEAGPWSLQGVPVEALRKARRGWLRYDGMGMEGGSAPHACEISLNGVDLGRVAAAGGDEGRGIWAERVGLPLTAEAIARLGRFNRVELRNPRRDWFKVRRFWIELELEDGRRCSSEISTAVFSQPPEWPHAEGIRVPFGEDIRVGLPFRP